ncbi:MAG: hypothetical protein QUU85_17010 [Candidatus Eisenbacteria bacterium]|nr:hypothetical protein [Candidatus Eisenbacteria bacterium]
MIARVARSRRCRSILVVLPWLALAGAVLAAPPAAAQVKQRADSTFHPVVGDPAFTTRHPKILFDEAHHNFHTLDGRYAAFGELMRADGFEVAPNREPFRAETLKGSDVLVIANALGGDWDSGGDSAAALPAFQPDEIEAVYRGVKDGGALLLIADHAPFGSAAAALGERFGVQMSLSLIHI